VAHNSAVLSRSLRRSLSDPVIRSSRMHQFAVVMDSQHSLNFRRLSSKLPCSGSAEHERWLE